MLGRSRRQFTRIYLRTLAGLMEAAEAELAFGLIFQFIRHSEVRLINRRDR